jgi:hypothetical protein
MLPDMAVLRHFVIGLLSIALMVGTGWQSCATVQPQHPSSATRQLDQIASHQSHEHHQHAMAQDRPPPVDMASADNGQPESADHACLKCCGACMLTSLMPLAPGWTVVPVASRVTFAALSEQLRGHIVFRSGHPEAYRLI